MRPIYRGILALISYSIVKYYMKKYPKLDVNPLHYALGTYIFSFVICMLCFAYIVKQHKDIEKLFEDIKKTTLK